MIHLKYKDGALKEAIKHALIALVIILSVTGIHAINPIKNGGQWANATLNYEANVKSDGSILFTGCSEGQDLAFRLIPQAGKANEFMFSNDIPFDCENPFIDTYRAKYVSNDEYMLICLYDAKGRLLDVLQLMGEEEPLREADWKMTRQLLGEYTSSKGEQLIIDGREVMIFDGKYIGYEKNVFNDIIMDVIEIKGDTRLKGFWKVNVTGEGLKLSKVITEDEFLRFFTPTGEEEVFYWTSKDTPRFQFASEILLNGDQLRYVDNKNLRLMRNEIFFHHGYVPMSQDLRDYLVGKEWYHPRSSNDEAIRELSLIENLNVEFIKTNEQLREEQLKRQAEEEQDDAADDNAFNFARYRQAMLDQAEANLMWRKSLDDINFASYAFIDVDNDGTMEVWARDDGSQDFQGVYAITPDGDVELIQNCDACSDLVFYPGAIAYKGYYGSGESREGVQTVKDSKLDKYCYKRVLVDAYSEDEEVVEEDYNINGKSSTEAEYDAFCKRLGNPYKPSVEWLSCQ